MRIFIENCFHWIGFHIVNKLLQEGHEVVGKDDKIGDKDDFLFDFLGRNAAFTLFKANQKRRYDYEISVDTRTSKSKTNEIIQVKKYNKDGFLVHQTKLIVSLLIGEWMPMKKDGVLFQNKFICFHSKQLMQEAIYMEDFTSFFMQILNSSHVPPIIEVKSSKTEKVTNGNVEKYIYIIDNRPKDQVIGLLRNHYHQFKYVYEKD